MTRLFVIVEGDTEQEFVKHCLAPHLHALHVWTTPIEVTTLATTKRPTAPSSRPRSESTASNSAVRASVRGSRSSRHWDNGLSADVRID